MAHPDEGYLIPDELWEGHVHPETGENCYEDDPFVSYRNELIVLQQEFPKDAVLSAAQAERLRQRREKLAQMRRDALNDKPLED